MKAQTVGKDMLPFLLKKQKDLSMYLVATNATWYV